MLQSIEHLLRYFIYLGVLIGGWLLVSPLIKPSIRIAMANRRYRNLGKSTQIKEIKHYKNPIIKDISNVLAVTLNKRGDYPLTSFFTLVIVLLLLSFMAMYSIKQSLLTCLTLSTLIAVFPYVGLRIKLHSIRVDGSYEGEGLLTELTNQYKINSNNMMEAIDRSIGNLRDCPHSRRALFRISMGCKEMKSLDDMNEIIDEFVFSLGTDWAVLLGNILHMSLGYRDNVAQSLDDLLTQLEDARMVREKDKQENAETFFLVKYAAPGLYITSVFFMIDMFGFTLKKYLEYQFKNPTGFQSFITFSILFAVSIVIYYFMRKPPNDV